MIFSSVRYNPFNSTVVVHTDHKLQILDLNFHTVAATDFEENSGLATSKKIDIVDEYTVLWTHNGGSTLVDLRTMKPLLSFKKKKLDEVSLNPINLLLYYQNSSTENRTAGH